MFEGLTFRMATEAELPTVLDLRQSVYSEDLGHVPVDCLDDRSHHLVATDGIGRVVAAARIVGPDLRPFDFEAQIDLSRYIGPDRIPALLGRLCVRRDYRSVSYGTFVHIGLLKLALMFAQQHGVTDFFLYAFDYLVNFYRGALFYPLNVRIQIEPAGSMHLMHLDIPALLRSSAQSRPRLLSLLLDDQAAPRITLPE